MRNEKILSTKEIAWELQVQPATIRRWVREGRIPEIRISLKVRRYNLEDILSALQRQKQRQMVQQ